MRPRLRISQIVEEGGDNQQVDVAPRVGLSRRFRFAGDGKFHVGAHLFEGGEI